MRLSKSVRRAVAEMQISRKGSYKQLLTLNLPRGSEISLVKLPAFLHTQLSCIICNTIELTSSYYSVTQPTGHGPALRRPKGKNQYAHTSDESHTIHILATTQFF